MDYPATSSVTVLVLKTVSVLNFIIALISGLLFLISILIAVRHPLTAISWIAFCAEMLLNAFFIAGLIYFGFYFWRKDVTVLRGSIWFFGSESLYFLLVLAALFARFNKDFWMPFGIGNLAFIPQVMTVYPISVGAALISTYLVARRMETRKEDGRSRPFV